MAIFGAGSDWNGAEQASRFFDSNSYEIGWDVNEARDLHQLVRGLKASDIIYLKANRPGSSEIRVKGIGVVIEQWQALQNDCHSSTNSTSISYFLPVKWVIKDEFHIHIPDNTGKLTNIRAATFYEEFHPHVITSIINRIWI